MYYKFQKIRLNVDKITTPNLSQIKEIIKRVHFANIETKQQILDNKGNAYYKIFETDEAETFYNLTLSYTIEAEKTGVVYGTFEKKEDKDGNVSTIFNGKGKINQFNNYARFLADITSGKVIYSKTLKRFVSVLKNAYKLIDETSFNIEYPVDRGSQISDFLNVIEQIFETVINVKTHDYNIFPYSFGGTDWVYNCQKLQLKDKVHCEKDLYFQFFDVAKNDLNLEIVEDYLKLIADSEHSFNNVSLMHAYTLLRKLKLVPPERFFIMKDYGRTGKGLLMLTFDDVFKINKVNFDNLITGGFEANNEWLNFYDTDLAHANETGEITPKQMRIMRKIATAETVSGRGIGKDNFKFGIRAVLIIDTNEAVEIGEITANTSRAVSIAFKDRPDNETDEQRYQIFAPYWEFIRPNSMTSLQANVSFLIYSLNYLKKLNNKFQFDKVILKNYHSIKQLTETQILLSIALNKSDFVLRSDEELTKLIENDYINLRRDKAKDDFKKIGVSWNKSKKIDGKAYRGFAIDDIEKHKQVIDLIIQSGDYDDYFTN